MCSNTGMMSTTSTIPSPLLSISQAKCAESGANIFYPGDEADLRFLQAYVKVHGEFWRLPDIAFVPFTFKQVLLQLERTLGWG